MLLTIISRRLTRFTLIEDDPELLYQGICLFNFFSRPLSNLTERKTKTELESYLLNFYPSDTYSTRADSRRSYMVRPCETFSNS